MRKLTTAILLFLSVASYGQFGVLVGNFSEDTSNYQTDSLMYYSPFNGNADDLSGNNFDGTVSGAFPTVDSLGNSDAALGFSPDSLSRVTLPIQDSINLDTSFTVCAWIKDTSVTNISTIIQYKNSSNFRFVIQHRGNALRVLMLKSDQNEAFSYNLYKSDNWVHLTAVWNGSDFMIYYDNVLQTQTGDSGPTAGATQGVKIGADTDNGNIFNGEIDEFFIYQKALNTSERQNVMDNLGE